MSRTGPKPYGKMNNAFDPTAAGGLPARVRSLVERRASALGPAYRLFYREPVNIVRGHGTKLWDEDGREYLDAYNNVVSVGHGHQRVADAVHQQMLTLCTHTRYLHEAILGYAEDLLETVSDLPGPYHVMFTCTGSESNDLAMRIARHRTGNRGIIVTSEAYHGNSDLTAGMSPSLGDNSPLGEWVRRIPAPDSYRLGAEQVAESFPGWIRHAIEDLHRHGQGLAAFIADSLFTSDGIFSEPAGLLAPVADLVHEAGGLLVADEVQSGFARTGEAMWGFSRHHATPDIVTLGKPMGNGYPVGGVIVSHDAVAGFGHDLRYFNTFGGNTVAIAAAQATLDVIRDERLMVNAAKIGGLISAGLGELAGRHECIGDIRGAGLYLGVEIVRDRGTKAPDGPRAAGIVNGLRGRRVLISATGPHANVLKIRPPLVFSDSDADALLTTLEDVLAAAPASGSQRKGIRR